MKKVAFAVATMLSAGPALAHTGLHHHPHGIEGAWVLLVLAGVVAGWAAAKVWGRK